MSPALAKLVFEVAEASYSVHGFDASMAVALGMAPEDASAFALAAAMPGHEIAGLSPDSVKSPPRPIGFVLPHGPETFLGHEPYKQVGKWGSTITKKWWGYQVSLEKDTAHALADLLHDIETGVDRAAGVAAGAAVLGGGAAAGEIAAVLWAAGSAAGAYGSWIEAADECNGVNINFIGVPGPPPVYVPVVTTR